MMSDLFELGNKCAWIAFITNNRLITLLTNETNFLYDSRSFDGCDWTE